MENNRLYCLFSFFALLCVYCIWPTALSAASIKTTQTSDLKSSTSSGFSGTQPTQNTQQTGTVSSGGSLADTSRRYESPQNQIVRGTSFSENQRLSTLDQPESSALGTKIAYADIIGSQSISGAETTVKSGDTSFLKKHLIRSPGSKNPERRDTEKYLSYNGQDIADHYKEREEEDVELIYK